MLKTNTCFGWGLFLFHGLPTQEVGSIISDEELGDLFYCVGPHRNLRWLQLMKENLGRGFGEKWRWIDRRGSFLKRRSLKNLKALGCKQNEPYFLRSQFPTAGRRRRRRRRRRKTASHTQTQAHRHTDTQTHTHTHTHTRTHARTHAHCVCKVHMPQ